MADRDWAKLGWHRILGLWSCALSASKYAQVWQEPDGRHMYHVHGGSVREAPDEFAALLVASVALGLVTGEEGTENKQEKPCT